MDKKAIRKAILLQRDQLSTEDCLKKSNAITHRLKDFIGQHTIKTVASFMSFRNEVATESFNNWLLENGYTLALPYIDPKEKTMSFYSITDFSDLVESSYGILEPDPLKATKIDSTAMDCIITPGVAFDNLGYRIGYGGGFYDKLFQDIDQNIYRIGVAFDLQRVEKIPAESYDQRVYAIATESELITF